MSSHAEHHFLPSATSKRCLYCASTEQMGHSEGCRKPDSPHIVMSDLCYTMLMLGLKATRAERDDDEEASLVTVCTVCGRISEEISSKLGCWCAGAPEPERFKKMPAEEACDVVEAFVEKNSDLQDLMDAAEKILDEREETDEESSDEDDEGESDEEDDEESDNENKRRK